MGWIDWIDIIDRMENLVEDESKVFIVVELGGLAGLIVGCVD